MLCEKLCELINFIHLQSPASKRRFATARPVTAGPSQHSMHGPPTQHGALNHFDPTFFVRAPLTSSHAPTMQLSLPVPKSVHGLQHALLGGRRWLACWLASFRRCC